MSDDTQESTHTPASAAVEINMSKVATTVVLAIIAWVGYSIHDLTGSVGTLTMQMTKMGTSMEHHAKTLQKWEDSLQRTQTAITDLREEYRESKHARSERITKLEHVVSGIQKEQVDQATRVFSVEDIAKRVQRIEERVSMD